MKIIHFANWNSTNIGNGALIKGTEKLLKEDASFSVDFIPEAWDDYTFGLKKFDQSFVDLVNSSDALLVNGAVTMNAFRRFTKNTGMRFDLPLHLWDAIKKPIIFYGISYRCWPFQEYPNKSALKKTFEYMIQRKDIFFGVRNDGTKEWIERTLGVVSEKIIEVPDPGFFVPAFKGEYPELHKSKKNIIIAFNGEDPVYRFSGSVERFVWPLLSKFIAESKIESIFKALPFYRRNRRRIITQIARSVEDISRKIDCQFILCPHYLDDYGMINEFIDIVDERIAHQLTVSTGLLKVPHTEYFYGRYAQVDLVIAMRVHSMSPSLGLQVPVVPLVSQGRMRVYLSKIGLSDIAVDIKEHAFSANLTEKSLKLLSSPKDYKEKVEIAHEQLRAMARTCNKKVYSLFQ